MTPKEVEELLTDCPTLYHASEEGAWPSIQEHGLFSCSALLDRYQIPEQDRRKLEESRRSASVRLERAGLPSATLRDQLPMSDAGLRRCLPEHLNPSYWYRTLNCKVFFWLSHDRLLRLLGAESYVNKRHDVLEINARAFVDAYAEKIWLCPINSGYTKYIPAPRDENTFRRISDYPYSSLRNSRARGEQAVELAVDYSVPDISKYVTRVSTRDAAGEVAEIFRVS